MDYSDYDDDGLAARLRIKLTTLRAWRCRQKDKLPPGTKVGRNWFFDKVVVEEWLASKREPATTFSSTKEPAGPVLNKRERGRPPKHVAATQQGGTSRGRSRG